MDGLSPVWTPDRLGRATPLASKIYNHCKSLNSFNGHLKSSNNKTVQGTEKVVSGQCN